MRCPRSSVINATSNLGAEQFLHLSGVSSMNHNCKNHCQQESWSHWECKYTIGSNLQHAEPPLL